MLEAQPEQGAPVATRLSTAGARIIACDDLYGQVGGAIPNSPFGQLSDSHLGERFGTVSGLPQPCS